MGRVTVFLNFLKNRRRKTQTPHLSRRAEFEEILANYRPSPKTIEILKQTPLVTLTAPTASGRNTIINKLVGTGRYHFIISDTTRPPRQNNGTWEKNGREYFFRNEHDILNDIKAGAFVEAEVIHSQQVSGVSAREIERAHAEDKIAIADVDIEGGIALSKLKPNVVSICVVPPDFNEWLKRIHSREAIEELNLHRRLRQATKVIKLALEHPKFVFIVNDKLDDAVAAVDVLATHRKHDPEHEKSARQVAKQLYDQTIKYLDTHATGTLD